MSNFADEAFFLSIDGKTERGVSSAPIINPAWGSAFAEAPVASEAQLDAAVDAARRAQPDWARRSWDERSHLVSAIGDIIADHAEALAPLLTREQGKPLPDALAELRRAADWCRGAATLRLQDRVIEESPERRSVTRRVPIGVVGAIAPWNSPISLAAWKFAPALLAGDSVILKPSPFTPLTTLRLGELIQAILPPGVMNVISGDDRLGPLMTAHPGIDKISFTGSIETGRKVMESAARTLKGVTLELGGNDPAIVLPDANVDRIVPELFWAAFRNSGQICIAAKRMFVHEAIYDRVAAGLAAFASTVPIGDGLQPGVQLGPVQNLQQFERVRALIQETQASGYRLLAGGMPPNGQQGYFVPVTLVDDPPDEATVVRQEAFGPVLPLLRFRDEDEVVRRANATEFGLGATIWSEDESAALELGNRLRCGNLWINEAMHATPFTPFGGHRQSGVGVENGLEGLLEYTLSQTISVRRRCSRADAAAPPPA